MLKRLFDILFSLGALIFLSPLFLACALAVKLSSPGPLLYGHMRIGKNGKTFRCLKFRTMFLNADQTLDLVLATNPLLQSEWKTYYKLKTDPRITSAGRWIRKMSLDELPQFINILFGQMSVVGPRPLTKEEVENHLGNKARKILSVRPGLTCLWVVKGRNSLTYEERIRLEEYYIDHQNFWYDLQLIAKTALCLLFAKGAY